MQVQVSKAVGFGVAEVTDVIPGCTVDVALLRNLLAETGVVCVRQPQKLTKDEFEWLASLFGDIKDPVGRTVSGEPFRYSEALQHINAGYVLTDELLVEQEKQGRSHGALDARRPGLFETWHCDDTYTREPALATVLHARELPPSGGGPTHFMDMRSAWHRLPAAEQEELLNLHVAYAYNNGNAFAPRQPASGPADVLEPVAHPLVRTHPLAGTLGLFIDLDRATHIEELPEKQGRALLTKLQAFAEQEADRCQHNWHNHDVLIWDNASVQHKAEGNFVLGEPRRFWRHMISAPPPA